MTVELPRRHFLSLLGLGAAAVGVELAAEPVRRWWQVGRNAPLPEQPLFRVATFEETVRLNAEHGAVYANTGTLFGIDAGAYREWKAAKYDGQGVSWEQLQAWQRDQDVKRIGSRVHHVGPRPEPVFTVDEATSLPADPYWQRWDPSRA